MRGAVVLITGGTGFLGRHLIRCLAALGAREICAYARDEKKHYDLRLEFAGRGLPLNPCIGDVRDLQWLTAAMRGCTRVIHAAALKHVTHCTEQPEEAVKTNVLGTMNVLAAARMQASPPHVTLISTDKCCAPVNIYGATKMLAEGLFRADHSVPRSIVRYGNVLSSTGSMVPFFRETAKCGKSIPVTDPEATRFLITAQQAVDLVVRAGDLYFGETLVPRLRSARVGDVAALFAERYGVGTHIIGLRPGEKLHEELLTPAELPLCEIDGDCVRIRAPEGGFEGLGSAPADIDIADFRSDGPVMGREDLRKFLEEEGEL